MRFVACFLMVTLLAGCKYDRSFLNMNSDSGSPFLGVQLSVDATDSQAVPANESVQLVSGRPVESVLTRRTETARAQSPEWTTASGSAASVVPAGFPSSRALGTIADDEHPLLAVGRQLAAF